MRSIALGRLIFLGARLERQARPAPAAMRAGRTLGEALERQILGKAREELIAFDEHVVATRAMQMHVGSTLARAAASIAASQVADRADEPTLRSAAPRHAKILRRPVKQCTAHPWGAQSRRSTACNRPRGRTVSLGRLSVDGYAIDLPAEMIGATPQS